MPNFGRVLFPFINYKRKFHISFLEIFRQIRNKYFFITHQIFLKILFKYFLLI